MMGLVSCLFIGSVFVIIANVHAVAEDDILSCLELFNPENVDKMCCESLESFDKIGKDTKDCMKENVEEWRCEDFECVMQKNGLMKGNAIDDVAVNKYLDELVRDNPQDKSAIDKVKSECLDGKYEAYPPEDACPVMKFYVCAYINVYLECDAWKSDETCSKMGQHAQKCRTAFEE